MPVISVIIPGYNNCRYIGQCIASATGQSFRDIEVIVVDDCSTDGTVEVVQGIAEQDPRVRLLRHAENQGTLAARKTGALASTGRYVMLIDQDDEFTPGSFAKLVDFAAQHPADIYHFAVTVDAANEAAARVAPGMEHALTPTFPELHGAEILRRQFSPTEGFDWLVHHRMFDGDFLRRAYAMAPDTRLVLADDYFMTFIIDSLAHEYRSTTEPWYVYHLGRGDTYGKAMTLDSYLTLSERNAKAYRLVEAFANTHRQEIPRDDWDARVKDALDKIIEQNMSEWKDNLPREYRVEALHAIEDQWPHDALCGELYRLVRDYAYEVFTAQDRTTPQALHSRDLALFYLELAEALERKYPMEDSTNQRYHAMRDIAFTHLRDSGLIAAEPDADTGTAETPEPAPAEPATSASPRRSWAARVRSAFGRLFR